MTLIEMTTDARRRGMASEAPLDLVPANPPEHGLLYAGGGRESAPRSKVECFQAGKVTCPSFVEVAILLLEQVRLGYPASSKRPRKRKGQTLASLADRIQGLICGGVDPELEITG
jgi:hypothetical protein